MAFGYLACARPTIGRVKFVGQLQLIHGACIIYPPKAVFQPGLVCSGKNERSRGIEGFPPSMGDIVREMALLVEGAVAVEYLRVTFLLSGDHLAMNGFTG